jgi:hypothetical protein
MVNYALARCSPMPAMIQPERDLAIDQEWWRDRNATELESLRRRCDLCPGTGWFRVAILVRFRDLIASLQFL